MSPAQYKSQLTQQLLDLVNDNPYEMRAAFSSIRDVGHEAYMVLRGSINERLLQDMTADDYDKMEYLVWRDDLHMAEAKLSQHQPTPEEESSLKQHPLYQLLQDRELKLDASADQCRTPEELDHLLVMMEAFMDQHAELLGMPIEAWKFTLLSELNQLQTNREGRIDSGGGWQAIDPEAADDFKTRAAELDLQAGKKPKGGPEGRNRVIKFPQK